VYGDTGDGSNSTDFDFTMTEEEVAASTSD
jgi:hypothetical protein